MKTDASRWSIQHELVRGDGKLLAIITVDGAWIDTRLRKLASPVPPVVKDVFEHFPRTEDFILM
jgi:acyl-CoA thioester hydrolase